MNAIAISSEASELEGNIVLQDETGGIYLEVDGDFSYQLGDVLSVDVSGKQIREYGGRIQITGIRPNDIESSNSRTEISTTTLTIEEIRQDQGKHDLSLIKLIAVPLKSEIVL